MFDDAKSWPFQEALSLLKHIEAKGKKPGDVVTFETGYGPSGAPHIGTLAEVVRTLWVMKAFDALTGNAYKTRLIMFSDDFDGMRKVPEGLPITMNDHLDQPLTHIPNPYGTEEASFGEANNMKLVDFVDKILKVYDGSVVGASHERSRVSFISSSASYLVGLFDNLLMRVWENYDTIQDIMLPTLKERSATYSAFIPLDHREGPRRGRYVYDYVAGKTDRPGIMRYTRLTKEGLDPSDVFETQVTGGRCKLQWKVDWAMRWVKFDVDYEMSGKDLIDSVKASQPICRVLGGTPPLSMTYELFTDRNGAKISKSRGNGFTMEEWLTYGTMESLQCFLFHAPTKQKPIHIDLVPEYEDKYIGLRQHEATPDEPTWFLRADGYRNTVPDIGYRLLLNLGVVSQAENAESLVNYLLQQRELSGADRTWVQLMAARVLNYGNAVGMFNRTARQPTEQEAAAFRELASRFSMMVPGMSEEAYQYQVYEVGKAHGFKPLRQWFVALYECFFGSSDGPRFGTFTKANGLENTIRLLQTYDKDPFGQFLVDSAGTLGRDHQLHC